MKIIILPVQTATNEEKTQLPNIASQQRRGKATTPTPTHRQTAKYLHLVNPEMRKSRLPSTINSAKHTTRQRSVGKRPPLRRQSMRKSHDKPSLIKYSFALLLTDRIILMAQLGVDIFLCLYIFLFRPRASTFVVHK